MIRYYSTNRQAPETDLAGALLKGQAADRGLFMPATIPPLSQSFLKKTRDLSYAETAAGFLEPFFDGLFSFDVLQQICQDAYSFSVPIEKVTENQFLLRLDQGPTASFKDFAAQFMGRIFGRLIEKQDKELVIITATSGDTGSAIAHAFHNIKGIRVIILFPIKEVSDIQRKQMTTLGGNIKTIAVSGKFDDCQALAKRAFSDPELASLNLSSANSINVGRLLPQAVYYLYAASRVADLAAGEKVIFSVPSGNFGDLMGGLLAFAGGLPVERFVVATNRNDEVPRFFKTKNYKKIVPSIECISNAMNVGHPSNLARLVDMYDGHLDEKGVLLKEPNLDRINQDMCAVSINDDETRKTIIDAYGKYKIVLEPHGAVAWAGLECFLEEQSDLSFPCISLETAHPAKFPDEIRALLKTEVPLPASLSGLEKKSEDFLEMDSDYAPFMALLKKEYA